MSDHKPNRHLKLWLAGIALGLWFALGCASTRAYEETLDVWVGKSAEELTEKWGSPQNIQLLADKNQAYQYTKYDKTSEKRGTASAPVSCQTNFFVNPNGVVVGWTHTGFDCRTK
jgi:hypothetical protein